MLQSLSIRNFAIIDRLDVEFAPGLTVLTGETGAGKSILIGALNVILGGRAGAELVRSDADRAVVDAVFDVAGSPELLQLLVRLGYDADDGSLLLTREIGAGGKSTARVGGRPATVAQLKEIGDWLVDLHGQHDHQSLLVASRHIDILDAWGGQETLCLRQNVGEAFVALQRLQAERAGLETDVRERAQLMDLYQFQVQEIEGVALSPGEDDALIADARRLANAQRLAEAAANAASALAGESGGVVEALGEQARALQDAAMLDDRLAGALGTVNSARFELEEAARDLARYAESIESNPERLEQIEDRLETIRTLKRKYGESIEDILEFGRDVAARLHTLRHGEERGQELGAAIVRAEAELTLLCARLSDRRRTLARDFAASVCAELAELAMERTRFDVQVDCIEPSAKGADRVELLIAPNPGEPLKPLARIASGGEVSRVMLAIKSAMARHEPLPTMVFDEIDAGVGGRTAGVVAEKLAALARGAQILCITHLPQIASRGDHHLHIEKRIESHVSSASGAGGERTVTGVVPLSPDQRVQEVARMLAGAEITETALRHAHELLQVGR